MSGAKEDDISTKGSRQWVEWAQQIQAIAQNGLTFAQSPFDTERYQTLVEIAAEMMAASSPTPMLHILQLFNQEKGYATPKVDVRGAVFKENNVLLVKERSDQKWTLPGGWADVNFSPAFCVRKEIQEESGFDVKVQKLVALYDKLRHSHPLQWPHTYKCFFLCELIGGVAQTSIETSAIDFFPVDKLPELSLHRVTPEQIARCYQHHLDQSLPTEFD